MFLPEAVPDTYSGDGRELHYERRKSRVTEQSLLVEKAAGIAVVTINRPQKGNAWTNEMYQEMAKIQRQLHEDPEVRVIILTGAGDSFFCAGVDLGILSRLDTNFILRELQFYQEINTRWERHSLPVIAAINGLVVGSGLELALTADIRIAADTAKFSINEVKLGINPDMGGTQRLTRVVGPSQAKRLILTGDIIDAQEAARIGLVDLVVPAGRLPEEARNLAGRIAANPPVAVNLAKKAINLATGTSLEQGLLFEQIASAYCFTTEDQKEAVQAIRTKSVPQFKGR